MMYIYIYIYTLPYFSTEIPEKSIDKARVADSQADFEQPPPFRKVRARNY